MKYRLDGASGFAYIISRAASSDGQIAQLVEQRTENPRVEGSTPPLATIRKQTEPSPWAVRFFVARTCCGRTSPPTVLKSLRDPRLMPRPLLARTVCSRIPGRAPVVMPSTIARIGSHSASSPSPCSLSPSAGQGRSGRARRSRAAWAPGHDRMRSGGTERSARRTLPDASIKARSKGSAMPKVCTEEHRGKSRQSPPVAKGPSARPRPTSPRKRSQKERARSAHHAPSSPCRHTRSGRRARVPAPSLIRPPPIAIRPPSPPAHG